MHYYKKNIGDYHKKAGRLSMLEHGAYTLLIDSCYDRERFPTKEEAIDWTWARTPEEITAVEFVLSKFFDFDGSVYSQNRIKEEIEKYNNNALINKEIAIKREQSRKENKSRREHGSCTNEHEATPNHKPLTINHKPLDDDDDLYTCEHQFLVLETNGKPFKPTEKFIDRLCDTFGVLRPEMITFLHQIFSIEEIKKPFDRVSDVKAKNWVIACCKNKYNRN